MLIAPLVRDLVQPMARALPIAATSALLSYAAPAAGSAVFNAGMPAGWTWNKGGFTATDDPVIEDEALVATFGPEAGQFGDPGTGTNAGRNAPRLETDAPAGDFVLYADWASDPMLAHLPQWSGAGFVLETAAGSARLELYIGANNTQVLSYNDFAGATVPGVAPTPPGESNGTRKGWPAHHKLERSGDTFTISASFDGINYSPVAQRTWAVTLTKVAVHCYHQNPSGATSVFRLKRATFGAPQRPTIRETVKRNTAFTANMSDLTGLVNASKTSGAVTVSGGKMTFSCATTDGSTARIRTSGTYGQNSGILVRAQRTSASQSSAFFCAAINGTTDPSPPADEDARWAGPYSPQIGNTWEQACGGDGARVVRCVREWIGSVDGAEGKFTYFGLKSPDEAELDDSTYIRFERVGPYLRGRAWDAVSPEPETWDFTVFDEVAMAEGVAGLSLSHNLGVPASAVVDVDLFQVYEVS
jgi:hypothetical protein